MGRRSDQVMESIGDGMRKEEYTQNNETIHDLLSMCVFDQLSFQRNGVTLLYSTVHILYCNCFFTVSFESSLCFVFKECNLFAG